MQFLITLLPCLLLLAAGIYCIVHPEMLWRGVFLIILGVLVTPSIRLRHRTKHNTEKEND